jgi:hypothetical protein
MSILVNACPKHGTHALQKAVELLGQHVGDVHHIGFGESLPDGISKHLYIYRDPRNAILSWMRWDGKSITDGSFMAALRGDRYIPTTRKFVGWMRAPQVHQVRYEDLVADDHALRRIADFLGVPYLESAFPNLPGLTRTWNVEHSDFRKIWTPAVAACWSEVGGDELVEAYGYVPYKLED